MVAQQDIKKAPEWVFPGAQVIVLTEARRGSKVEVDTVKNVGRRWITLQDDKTRIPLDTLSTQRTSYDGTNTKLINLYSEEGQRWLWRKKRTGVRLEVRDAIKAWEEKPYNAATRAALRSALDKLDDVIEEAW